MNELQLFINGWLVEPARWGVSDCCLSALDWVGKVKGLDLTEDLKLTYDDAVSAQRVTKFFTHPLRLARDYLELRAGCPPTTDPERGDVALFKVWHPHRGQPLPVAGICILPGLFACRGGQEDGAPIHSVRPERIIAGWRVGYEGL